MSIGSEIAHIRKEYSGHSLSEDNVDPDPVVQFARWWEEALKSEVFELNAMTLATCNLAGRPSARIVLLKGFSNDGFIFFSNYNSHKGKDFDENPLASLVFFWKELERQVRIEGRVEKINASESDDYFNIRPPLSKVSAVSSPQSTVIKSRQFLEEIFEKNKRELENGNIQRPQHWGGYIVKPDLIEFWQGRPNRLHDRLQYSFASDGKWIMERLAP